jgi:hypothetical protein
MIDRGKMRSKRSWVLAVCFVALALNVMYLVWMDPWLVVESDAAAYDTGAGTWRGVMAFRRRDCSQGESQAFTRFSEASISCSVTTIVSFG